MLRFGHYVVAGQRYVNKLQAYAAALPQGHWPHWDFYESEFGQHDWTQEPAESLSELYRARAQQIRSQYDYVICWFSGGSDSDNMVRSFLHNGIHIDEIWHRSSWQRIDRTDRGRDATNQANETRHAAIPLLQQYQTLSPGTKIEIFDAMDVAIDAWQQGARDPYEINYFNPLLPAKEKSSVWTSQKVASRRVVKLIGTDKPRVSYSQGKFWFWFFDNIVNINGIPSRESSLIDETDEFFYWSPEAARLLIKQAHVVKNWFTTHPELMWILEQIETSQQARDLYNIMVKTIIYPYWNPDTFVTDKPRTDIDHAEFFWFYKNPDSLARNNWLETAKSYQREILRIYDSVPVENKNYINIGNFTQLPGNYSKHYCLG